MKKVFKTTALAFVLCACLSGTAAFAAQAPTQRIVLKDTTVIIGQVVALKDGIYTIRSESMGEIKIDAAKISEISSLDNATAAPLPQPTREIAIRDGAHSRPSRADDAVKTSEDAVSQPGGSDDLSRQQQEVNSRVQSMTMNGDFLDSMLNLSETSSMADIMQDPEIMDAINRNDYDFLMNSEKMKNLMDSQEIKDLLGDVQP